MKNLLLLVALFLTLGCAAQTEGKAKLYGYVQSVAGSRDMEIAENGTAKETIRSGKNYLLYATSTNRIYPAEIWIEGTRYGVRVKIISKTPVVYQDETNIGSPEQTLVSTTTEKVVQLIPIPQLPKPVGDIPKTISGNNDFVLVYKQGDKFYYNTLKSLSDLSPAALQ